MSATRKRKPRSSDNPERIAKKAPRQKNAKSMFGDGTETAVTLVKASSRQKMRQNWIFMAGTRKSMMRSPIVGIFAMILAPSNPMNSTPMTLTTFSQTILHPLQASLTLHRRSLHLILHWSISIHNWHMPPVLHVSCVPRRCRFLVLQPQDILMRNTRHLRYFMIFWASCIHFHFHLRLALLLMKRVEGSLWRFPDWAGTTLHFMMPRLHCLLLNFWMPSTLQRVQRIRAGTLRGAIA